MIFENSSRRSFLKKSTALAVGVTAAALFTGLVNAQSYEPYVDDQGNCIFDMQERLGRLCGYTRAGLYSFMCDDRRCCWESVLCNGQEYIGMVFQCEEGTCGDVEILRIPVNVPQCDPLA